MKLSPLIAVVVSLASPALAGTWENGYVGTGEGNHPMAVSREKALAVDARVELDFPDGKTRLLIVRCGLLWNSDTKTDRVATDLILGGSFDTSGGEHVLASFDGELPVNLGAFYFNQGVPTGELRPQHLALLMMHKTVRLTTDSGSFDETFPLENAATAISKMECWGDKIQ